MPHAAFCTARALQGDLRLLGFGAADDADAVASSGPARRAALVFLAEVILPGVSDDDALASDEALAKFYADAGIASAALPQAAPVKRGAPAGPKCFAPMNAKPRSARERARAAAFLRAAIDLAFAASKRREVHSKAQKAEANVGERGESAEKDESSEAVEAEKTAESVAKDGNDPLGKRTETAEAEATRETSSSNDADKSVGADSKKSEPDPAAPPDDIDVYGSFTPEDAQLDAELAKLISLRPVLFPLSLRPAPAKRARAPLTDAGNSTARRPLVQSSKPGAQRKAVSSRTASINRAQPPARSGAARGGRTTTAARTQSARTGPARTGRTASVVRERPWSRAKKPAVPVAKKKEPSAVAPKKARPEEEGGLKDSETNKGNIRTGGKVEPKEEAKTANGAGGSNAAEKADASQTKLKQRRAMLANVSSVELLREANEGLEKAAADAAALGLTVPAEWKLVEPSAMVVPGVSALLESTERASGVVERFSAYADKLESIGEPVADEELSRVVPDVFRAQRDIFETARRCATARAAYRELEELVDAPKMPVEAIEYCRERSARAAGE